MQEKGHVSATGAVMNWRSGDNLHVSAQQARGGDIVLRKRWMRAVFLLGLGAPVIVALILTFIILAR
ncbi:MAG: hypothetical protein J7494_06170 [Sphingobium sp.]|nr:hypothetical protein [Sphingobium sp.]